MESIRHKQRQKRLEKSEEITNMLVLLDDGGRHSERFGWTSLTEELVQEAERV